MNGNDEYVIYEDAIFLDLATKSPSVVKKLRLVNLPSDINLIEGFKNLEELLLYQCYNIDLKKLLDKLSFLKKLRKLYFIDCNINRLPAEIGQLSDLEELSVIKNSLHELPIEIKKMAKLSVLNLKQNEFHEMPEIIYQLQELKMLNMEENKIYRVSPKILKLQKLQELFLALNPIRNLLDFNDFIKGLKKITLDEKQLAFSGAPKGFKNMVVINKSLSGADDSYLRKSL